MFLKTQTGSRDITTPDTAFCSHRNVVRVVLAARSINRPVTNGDAGCPVRREQDACILFTLIWGIKRLSRGAKNAVLYHHLNCSFIQ
jgi:hypothetical protein